MPTNRTRGARGGSKLPCTLRLRGDAKECASDTLADSRVQKPKNFLAFFSRLLPPPLHREAEKEWKGNFWFCFAVSVSEKSIIILSPFDCSFLRPHGDRGAPISVFGGSSMLRGSVHWS